MAGGTNVIQWKDIFVMELISEIVLQKCFNDHN